MNKEIMLVKVGQKSKYDLWTLPPIGICYLGAILMQDGYTVQLVDMKVQKLDARKLAEKVAAEKPAIVGLSTLTVDADLMVASAREIKKLSPGVKIVVGGPHATIHYDLLTADSAIDVAAVGESDDTIRQLVPALFNGGKLDDIQGIAFKNGDEDGYTFTGHPEPIEDLDRLPFPAFELLDMSVYFKQLSMAPLGTRKYLPIFTSRGCPYHCAYCHKVFGKRFRARSPENLIAEIKKRKEQFGVTEFEILDDIFNFDKNRMHTVLDQIIEEDLGIRFSFPNGVRADLLDEQDIKKLKKAGCIHITYAVEAASPRIQKLIKKFNKLEKIKENIEVARRYNIYTQGYFMMGFPGETEEELQMTRDFALSSKLNQASFFLVVPFEKTDLWDIVQQYCDFSPDQYYSKDFNINDFNLTAVDLKVLHKYHRESYRRFYFDPARIWGIIATHPYKRALFSYIYLLIRRTFGF